MDVNVNVTLNASPSLIAAIELLAGLRQAPKSLEGDLKVNGNIVAGDFKVETQAPTRKRSAPVVKEEAKPEEPKVEQQDEPITIESVRALVAEKAQAGKREGVKALLAEYETDKVTSLNPDKYSSFVKELAAL